MALQISGVAGGVLRMIHQQTKYGFPGPLSLSFSTRSISTTHVVQSRNALALVMATPSDSNPTSTSGGGEEKAKAKQQPISTTGGGDRPPLATILAGFVVFFGFCWVLFTIGSWLFNLIVTPPPLK